MRVIPILLFFLVIFAAQAQHQRLIVAQDGSGDYASIQADVDAVQAYPLERVDIFIKDGVYREQIVGPSWKTSINFGNDAGSVLQAVALHVEDNPVYLKKSYHRRIRTRHNYTTLLVTSDPKAGRAGIKRRQ